MENHMKMGRVLILGLLVNMAGGGFVAEGGSLLDVPLPKESQAYNVLSPDRKRTAVFTLTRRNSLPLPPEAGRVLSRGARLEVKEAGRILFDSQEQRLSVWQSAPWFAVDASWSPDSARLAYRIVASLEVVGPGGKPGLSWFDPAGFSVSSFRWTSNNRLLVVLKRGSPNTWQGGEPALFQGYLDQAAEIRIARLDVESGTANIRISRRLKNPTFLFHSIGFAVEEISPTQARVAFSDGSKFYVYDDQAGKIIAEATIPRNELPKPNYSGPEYTAGMAAAVAAMPPKIAVEGIWWTYDDTLVIGVGLLSGSFSAFYRFDCKTGALTDCSSVLSPVWNTNGAGQLYRDRDWYRPALAGAN
jgi:hypothetical protein